MLPQSTPSRPQAPWQAYMAQKERARLCAEDGHSYVWTEHEGKRTKHGFRQWSLRGICRRCGDTTFRRSPRSHTFAPRSREMNEQAMALLSAAGCHFVRIQIPGEKTPPERKGWQRRDKASDLTISEATFDRYMEGEQNIAVVLGKRLIEIDVDIPLAELYERHPEVEGYLSEALIVESPRGHKIVFLLPPDITLTKSTGGRTRLGQGVDVLTKGAYTLAPGGWINPEVYERDGKTAPRTRYITVQVPAKSSLAIIPQGLLDLVMPAPSPEPSPSPGRKTKAKGSASSPHPDAVHPGSRAQWEAIAALAPEDIHEGNRDNWVFVRAAHWGRDRLARQQPLTQADCVKYAHWLNSQLSCPLSSKQVNGKFDTCYRWAHKLLGQAAGRWTQEQRSRGGKARTIQMHSASAPRDIQARDLELQGLSWRAIGRRLEVDHHTAKRMARRGLLLLQETPSSSSFSSSSMFSTLPTPEEADSEGGRGLRMDDLEDWLRGTDPGQPLGVSW